MAKDFILDEDFDIVLDDGDLMFDHANQQNIESLCLISKGELKYSPLTGVGIRRLINARAGEREAVKEIKLQLRADNWKNESVGFQNEELVITADR